MTAWAENIIKRKINKEMRALAPLTRSAPEDLTEEMLLDIKLSDMITRTKAAAPTLWSILQSASYTPLQAKRNTYKTPDTSIIMITAMMSYSRSNRRCKLQKVNSIYLKSTGLASKGFDTLNAYGLTMNQKWVYTGLERLSETSRTTLLLEIKTFPYRGSHDNLNIRFVAYEQRLNNSTHFDSGTAATIFVIKDPSVIVPDCAAYQAKWASGAKDPITYPEILDLDYNATTRLDQQSIHIILGFLVNAPAFEFNTYVYKDSEVFSRPPAVLQLATGPEHATQQFVLDTEHEEEASYDGNERCLGLWFKQLKVLTDMQKANMSRKYPIVWIGDQLTTSRIRGLKKFFAWDDNAWDRLEFFY
ncbi:hypothetical protein EW026_g7797 [Hermanssonia centrifuga]|uniref:DUF6589 domain-containing protein n=1 Tax=Hermanssonia centrifuga TaxID=98765 RepID=A0A4S4KAY6_9APHY|nr:hypothetical protein EW026_g7797 [Hermanssonia centrifuga]